VRDERVALDSVCGDRVYASEPEETRVPLGLGTGSDLDILPLKSRFYD
jgi:hypothetical protein